MNFRQSKAFSNQSLANFAPFASSVGLPENTTIPPAEERDITSQKTILCWTLSTRTEFHIITKPSEPPSPSSPLPIVGQGRCGTVYLLDPHHGTGVLKLPNSPRDVESIQLEYAAHRIIYSAFSSFESPAGNRIVVHIPSQRLWVRPDDIGFWDKFPASRFTPDNQNAQEGETESEMVLPTYGLLTQRICPLPLDLRSALVDVFAPSYIRNIKDEFLAREENKHCLVRVYLGRDSTNYNENASSDSSNNSSDDSYTITDETCPNMESLQNFPLHRDQMVDLGLRTKPFAEAMGNALAILHWEAGVDAWGVEFVLGSLWRNIPKNDKDTFVTNIGHTLALWLVDFDECRVFVWNQNGLQRIVDAFWANDPYFPRPDDEELWAEFKMHYLLTSYDLGVFRMAIRFIEGVERISSERVGEVGEITEE